MPDDDLISVKDAADELGIAPESLYEAIHENRIVYRKVVGRYAILRADLDAYKLRTRPTGKKPKGRPRKAV